MADGIWQRSLMIIEWVGAIAFYPYDRRSGNDRGLGVCVLGVCGNRETIPWDWRIRGVMGRGGAGPLQEWFG